MVLFRAGSLQCTWVLMKMVSEEVQAQVRRNKDARHDSQSFLQVTNVNRFPLIWCGSQPQRLTNSLAVALLPFWSAAPLFSPIYDRGSGYIQYVYMYYLISVQALMQIEIGDEGDLSSKSQYTSKVYCSWRECKCCDSMGSRWLEFCVSASTECYNHLFLFERNASMNVQHNWFL